MAVNVMTPVTSLMEISGYLDTTPRQPDGKLARLGGAIQCRMNVLYVANRFPKEVPRRAMHPIKHVWPGRN